MTVERAELGPGTERLFKRIRGIASKARIGTGADKYVNENRSSIYAGR
jgi:hypothetical protein